jgi:hypothetical protein
MLIIAICQVRGTNTPSKGVKYGHTYEAHLGRRENGKEPLVVVEQ